VREAVLAALNEFPAAGDNAWRLRAWLSAHTLILPESAAWMSSKPVDYPARPSPRGSFQLVVGSSRPATEGPRLHRLYPGLPVYGFTLPL
jgi:hypothetical protein